jgi:hypothetical protein
LVSWRVQSAATAALCLAFSVHASAADYTKKVTSAAARAAVEAFGKGGQKVGQWSTSKLNSTVAVGPKDYSASRDTANGKYNLKLQLDGIGKEWWTNISLLYDERGSNLKISSPKLEKTFVYPCIYGVCGPAANAKLQGNASFPMIFGTAQPRIELKGELGIGAGCGYNCAARITGMLQAWGNVRLEPSYSRKALETKATAYIGPQFKAELLCVGKFTWNYQHRLAEKVYYVKTF